MPQEQSSLAPFTPYDARWAYSDPELGGVSLPVTVRGRPNNDDDVLCRVSVTRGLDRRRGADVMIPLRDIVAMDQDCSLTAPLWDNGRYVTRNVAY